MKCPNCGAELVLSKSFEEKRSSPVNVEEMGIDQARIVFFESADSYDFIDGQYDCPNGHTWYSGAK